MLIAAVAAAPTVIEKTTQLQPIVQQVATTPEPVIQLFQLLGLVVAGFVTSTIHQLLERGRLGGNVNRLILAAYTVVASLVYGYMTGNLHVDAQSLTDLTTAAAAIFTAAQGRYELFKFITNALTAKDSDGTTSETNDNAVIPQKTAAF